MEALTAVILAAGQGTRMKSAYPKVLHKVGGVPMAAQVLRTAREAGFEKCVVITGYMEDWVRSALGDAGALFVRQEEQLGTAHAVSQAIPELDDAEYVLVICGDTPLIRSETVSRLLSVCREESAVATVLTAMVDNPFGYGRVMRDKEGHMTSIVEEKDCTEEERACREINTGTYVFEAKSLLEALPQVGNHNAQGEYYLTDVFAWLIQRGHKVIPVVADDAEETMGINSRGQLAQAEAALRRRKAEALMESGVTVIDPERIYVERDVKVGRDTVIWPGTVLQGKTVIGEGCVIGPDTQLSDTICGDGTSLNRVYAQDCHIGSHNDIGPFVHLRPRTILRDHVKIGNFVEVKNSDIGKGTKLPHHIYCGDADVGERVNFGCGTVTVNFDGKEKHRCIVADHAFIGCNTNLVAPVHIGERAFTAAGSTVTKDVPAHALAIERSKQKNILGWVKEDTYKD